MANLIQIAEQNGRFTTFLRGLEMAGLTEILGGPGPYTVFAPLDEAFSGLDQEALSDLMADREALRSVLEYHIVPGRFTSAELRSMLLAASHAGDEIEFLEDQGRFYVNDSEIVQADLLADNGVLHGVDAVVNPLEEDEAESDEESPLLA